MPSRFHHLLSAVQDAKSVFTSTELRSGIAGDSLRYREVMRLAEALER